jgi:LmbE family N-acetylglucosaminyl deacetylase
MTGQNVDMIGSVLGVWAHPDDEAYLSAGLMLRARRAGHRVFVVTATAGELGTPNPDEWPPERLMAVRRDELANSLRILGVHEHLELGLPDGSCHKHDETPRLISLIDEIRPAVIVTFGPDGMTGHLDHRTVCAWTTEAWRQADHRAQLWYATTTPAFHRRWGAAHERLELFAEHGPPPTVEESDLAARLDLDDEETTLKFEALRAQESQTAAVIDALGEADYREWWRTEFFRTPDSAVSPAPR